MVSLLRLAHRISFFKRCEEYLRAMDRSTVLAVMRFFLIRARSVSYLTGASVVSEVVLLAGWEVERASHDDSVKLLLVAFRTSNTK